MLMSNIPKGNKIYKSSMENRKKISPRSQWIRKQAERNEHMSFAVRWQASSLTLDSNFRGFGETTHQAGLCATASNENWISAPHRGGGLFSFFSFENDTRTLTGIKTSKKGKSMKALEWLYESPTVQNTQHAA